MTFDDFFHEFDILEICHLSPDTFEEELQVNIPSPTTSVIKDQRRSIVVDYFPMQRKTWSCLSFEGQWIVNFSSGGRCVTACEHRCGFWTNPQYEIETSAEDQSVKCAIVISLMQKYNRLKSTENPLDRYDYIQVIDSTFPIDVNALSAGSNLQNNNGQSGTLPTLSRSSVG